jgi:hypothetical protein
VRTLAAVLILAALAGCGSRPPDEATSRDLVAQTVLDWHRLQAAGDGGAACALVTEKQQDAIVKLDRETMKSVGRPPRESCEEIVDGYAGMPDGFRQLMLSTQVDSVAVDGDHATVTAHTQAAVGGVTRQTEPTEIPLRWDDGRWRID